MQVAAAVFGFRGTVLTKRSNFAADLDVWRNANRDLYFAARAVKHIRLEMAQLQRQYPGVQWGFFCTGKPSNACNLGQAVCKPVILCLMRGQCPWSWQCDQTAIAFLIRCTLDRQFTVFHQKWL